MHSKRFVLELKNEDLLSKRLLSSLGIETQLNKIRSLGGILRIKLNEILNNVLLAGDKFMPQMHLKQLGFNYNACGPFTKNKERIKKFRETGYTDFTYRNDQLVFNVICFQLIQNMTDIKKD